jgi:hypothetical protein
MNVLLVVGVADQSGEHTEPVQFACPDASRAKRFLSSVPYRTPFATVIGASPASGVVDVHIGEHTLGEPGQFTIPEASKADTPLDPLTKSEPLPTGAGGNAPGTSVVVQRGVQTFSVPCGAQSVAP